MRIDRSRGRLDRIIERERVHARQHSRVLKTRRDLPSFPAAQRADCNGTSLFLRFLSFFFRRVASNSAESRDQA
jgi:hypothetical protein